MRLGTCIAVEIAIACGAAAGSWFGLGYAGTIAREYLATHEAQAASRIDPSAHPVAVVSPEPVSSPPLRVSVRRLPSARLEAPAPRVETSGTVFGAPDEELLAPLGAADVTRVKVNHGGTSLSLRVDFANGSRAAFKPEQIHLQSDPRREIAAYRLDRLLGIGRVPPAKPTTIALEALIAAADPRHQRFLRERLEDEAIVRRGQMHGELSWWVPEIKLAKLGPHRIDEKAGKDAWRAYLQIGADIPADVRPLVEQIASLVLFDVLIDNPDRWTGANTVMSPDGLTLFFMDNTMSFSRFAFGHESNLLALRRIQVFPRRLVSALRTLTRDTLVAAFALPDGHPLAPLLEPAEVDAILVRRDNLMKHVDALIAQHGEDVVLAFP